MNKIAFALLLCLVPAFWSGAAETPTAEPTPMAQAVAAIKLKPKWGRIELYSESRKSYYLTLHYKPAGQKGSPVVTLADAEADTKAIARAVLAQLVKEGRKPATEHIVLLVHAQQAGFKGETGTELVRPFGSTSYNFNNDRLEWKIYRSR